MRTTKTSQSVRTSPSSPLSGGATTVHPSPTHRTTAHSAADINLPPASPVNLQVRTYLQRTFPRAANPPGRASRAPAAVRPVFSSRANV